MAWARSSLKETKNTLSIFFFPFLLHGGLERLEGVLFQHTVLDCSPSWIAGEVAEFGENKAVLAF